MKPIPDLMPHRLGTGLRPTTPRLHEIDGIRGWAALSVLIYHFHIELLHQVLPQVNGFVPRFFVHGPLSVAIFFVLSGDALSSAYFAGGRSALDAMVVKRYFRLTGPILLACAVVWLLMRAGLVWHVPASRLLGQEAWLGACLDIEPTLLSLFHYALYGVYTHHVNTTSYNPFLWTMSVELAGSILVFLYLYLHDRLQQPKTVLMALIAATFLLRSFHALFFLGILFGLWRREGLFDRLARHRRWPPVAMALLLACAALDAWNVTGPKLGGHVDLVLGPAMVFAFHSLHPLKAFFSSRLSRFLGDISFSLYLIHFSVMVSFTSALVVAQGAAVAEQPLILIGIATASAVVSLLAATLMWLLERQGMTYLAWLPARILRRAA